MCGIFGHLGPLKDHTARECLSRLSHRGPDGSGLEVMDGAVLGHTRLSILDTSPAGQQPMRSIDGGLIITFNGEIYNFIELKKELETLGHTFRTGTDTEVILAAYRQWGDECQLRFNGMWAFAIYDTSARTLFLSRDPFGKKPLFHTKTRDGIAFASEMKALLPLIDAPTVDYDLLSDPERVHTYEATTACLFREITRFPAGHHALLKPGDTGVTPIRWWHTLDHLIVPPSRFEEQAEMLKELFLDACRIRLRSDVPIGNSLSGGLDSSAVACAVAHLGKHASTDRQAENWQNSFTASFPGTPVDEVKYAHAVNRFTGINGTTVEIDPMQVIADLERDFYLYEEIHTTMPSVFISSYKAMRDAGVKVTLDGHGGDELFAGYDYDFIQGINDANLFGAIQIARIYQQSLPQTPQFPKPSIYSLIKKQRMHKRRKFPPRVFKSQDSDHPAWQEMSSLNRSLYHTFTNVFPTLLRNYDRYSMANGVEIRMPLIDKRIVSFAFSIGWQAKLKGGYTKSILRHACKEFIPHDIAFRKSKLGFNAPMVNWMTGPWKSFLLDTVHSRRFQQSEAIHADTARQKLLTLCDTPSPPFSLAQDAWLSITPYFWEQAMAAPDQAAVAQV